MDDFQVEYVIENGVRDGDGFVVEARLQRDR
jgi:hypothetical protein